MTDKFEVPEPSEEAYTKFFERTDDKWLTHLSNCLRAAYAVDVPRIVRAEVAAFVQYVITHPKYLSGCMLLECHNEWDAARFGEGEPERPCAVCEVCWDKQYKPTPGAPAGGFRTEPHIGHTEHGDRVYGLADNPVFTQADRDRLAKLERFVTDLATAIEKDPMNWPLCVHPSAAREYLR